MRYSSLFPGLAGDADLESGQNGAPILALQRRLRESGFPPGREDGSFGAATEAAVLAFQHSEGLLADGIVGVRTAAALNLFSDHPAPPPMPPITIEIVARMFPSTPMPPIATHLPLVLGALQAASLTWPPIVLAAIATIRAEAEGFVPIDEYISRYNTSPGGTPFDLYDNRHDLGNHGTPDGAAFKGRGFVQLTGRDNYTRFGSLLGIPTLVEAPEQANDPSIAARLLAAFIRAQELPMKRALLEGRLATARTLVNGGSYGLGKFTDAYVIGSTLLGLPTGQLNMAA